MTGNTALPCFSHFPSITCLAPFPIQLSSFTALASHSSRPRLPFPPSHYPPPPVNLTQTFNPPSITLPSSLLVFLPPYRSTFSTSHSHSHSQPLHLLYPSHAHSQPLPPPSLSFPLTSRPDHENPPPFTTTRSSPPRRDALQHSEYATQILRRNGGGPGASEGTDSRHYWGSWEDGLWEGGDCVRSNFLGPDQYNANRPLLPYYRILKLTESLRVV